MRFREITPRDVPDCVRLLQSQGGRFGARVRRALPELWSHFAASSAPNPMMLIEDEEDAAHPIVGVLPAHFVRRESLLACLRAPCASVLDALYVSMLDGGHPIPGLDEVRAANSGDGLDALVGHPGHAPRPWHDPLLERMRRIAPLAFIHGFGGYRLRSLYHEALDVDAASYLRAGGFRPAHDAVDGVPGPDGDAHGLSRLFVRHRAEREPGAIDLLAAHVFHCEDPRLGLTPAEQRIVLRALGGECDRRIAAALRLSTETVRSAWESVYGRIERLVPAIFESGCDADRRGDVGHAGRGTEKRRCAVEYLRQHLHELRPHRAQDYRSQDPRTQDRRARDARSEDARDHGPGKPGLRSP